MKKDEVTINLPAKCQAAVEAILNETEPSGASQKLQRIGQLASAVGSLNAIAAGLPEVYGWRFITADNFKKVLQVQAKNGASAGALSRFYWRDTLATIEAYTVMSAWRMIDICQSAFRCMEDEAIVPCAILARSAFESAAQFVLDARTISASLEEVLKHDLTTGFAVSTELEQYLLQTVYASRQAGVEEIYKSKNILTVLGKIAKIVKNEPIVEEYEILCEVTHPNFLGRSTYIVNSENQDDTSELRFISPANGINTDTLMHSTLWALSWAIEAQATATHLLQGTIADFIPALPPEDAVLH